MAAVPLFLACAVLLNLADRTFSKPAEGLDFGVAARNPLPDIGPLEIVNGPPRRQRSPQFGLLDASEDYDDGDSYAKHGYKHKLKPHRKPHGGLGLLGGYGCRGISCGGWQPSYEVHPVAHPEGGHGGSFASASAGSLGQHGGYNGGHSEANAQSASFSIGPYTATFSAAQSFSKNHPGFGVSDY